MAFLPFVFLISLGWLNGVIIVGEFGPTAECMATVIIFAAAVFGVCA